MSVIISFFCLSLLSSVALKNLSTFEIDRFGTNLHPKNTKWFVSPPTWMRKTFKITKWAFIPRYLYFNLFLSLFFAALAPISSIIYITSDCNPIIARLLIFVPCCLGIIDIIFTTIMTAIAKKY